MPLGVLNPREIWLMVVLIVGLSLGGYISLQVLRPRRGDSAGRHPGRGRFQHRHHGQLCPLAPRRPVGARTAAIVIMIASTVMYVRVLVAVAVVSQEFLADAPAADGRPHVVDAAAGDGCCGIACGSEPLANAASNRTRRN